MKRKSKFGKNKSIGYGYVGKWRNQTIGWCLPDHLSFSTNLPKDRYYLNDKDKLYFCKITVEVLRNKRGRPTVRHYKTK